MLAPVSEARDMGHRCVGAEISTCVGVDAGSESRRRFLASHLFGDGAAEWMGHPHPFCTLIPCIDACENPSLAGEGIGLVRLEGCRIGRGSGLSGDSVGDRRLLGILKRPEDAVGIARQQVVFFKAEPDAPAELANGAVLLGGQGLEDDGEDHFGTFDGVDAKDLGIGDKNDRNSSLLRISVAILVK